VALQYARELAKRFGAELHVLHVVDATSPAVIAGIGSYAAAAPDLWQEMADAERHRVEALVSDRDRTELHARTVCEAAESPAEAIVRYAGNYLIDLIVMGTHGRRGVSRLVMGSVTEQVQRIAPCPVLTVRHPEREFIRQEETITGVPIYS
jgi:nucleotide-binding universal stress UspA family protein